MFEADNLSSITLDGWAYTGVKSHLDCPEDALTVAMGMVMRELLVLMSFIQRGVRLALRGQRSHF